MEAHATPDDLQILQSRRLVSYKAIRAMLVTRGGFEPMKSIAARGEVGRNSGNAWRCMQYSVEAKLLGFSSGRSWGTSVWLVLLGEGLMCTNLRSLVIVCLVVGF